MTFLSLTVLVTLFLLAFARDAHAYVDPGSGSLLLQVLLATLVGAMFYIRRVKEIVVTFFNRLLKREVSKDEHEKES